MVRVLAGMGYGSSTRRGATVVAVALALAGCGGGEMPPSPPPAPLPGPPPTSTGQTSADEVVQVKMENIQYMPKEVRVPTGGTVQWENTDSPPHTVTKKTGPGEGFDSGTMQPGDKFEQRFSKRGRVDYLCEIHPGQTGAVVVE